MMIITLLQQSIYSTQDKKMEGTDDFKRRSEEAGMEKDNNINWFGRFSFYGNTKLQSGCGD